MQVYLLATGEQELAAALAWFDGQQQPTGERVSSPPAATQLPLAIAGAAPEPPKGGHVHALTR